MIAANKRLIKANLTQGVTGIQNNLINLYASNLSAVATQAALIAGFAFSAVGNYAEPTSLVSLVLSYVYVWSYTVCLIAALFVLSQATIVVMFGPSLALKGDDEASVKIASEHMREQQSYVLKIGGVSVTCLFFGSCVFTWSTYPPGIATITTFAYMIGYYLLVTEGRKAYNLFVPQNDVTLGLETLQQQQESGSKSSYNAVSTERNSLGEGGTVLAGKSGGTQFASASDPSKNPHELKKLKAKGILWRRKAAEDGGMFVRSYAVLKDGRLDFYREEKDYLDHGNPINKKPFKLWQFNVETDPRKFARQVTSLANTMKSSLIGADSQDFSMKDLMSSEYDLSYAAKNFRFALVPKVSSELQSIDNVEMLAHDEKSYNQWVQALKTVVTAYDDIASMPTVDHTMRTGISDVEVVVQAANI